MANTAAYNANSANSTLTTNFNVTPYYDDYDRTKEYYRLLFKPGYAVQARELTQMQTTLQNQILRFGKHVFKDGDIVLPGSYHLKANASDKKGYPIDYVKIKTRNAANTAEVDVTTFLGQTVTGATSNISAQITEVLDSDGTVANTKTFYVTYLGAKPGDPTVRVFQPGETLTSANAGTAVVLDTDPVANTGYASWFGIDEGVYFAKDHFITFPTQSIVLDRYNPNPTCRVGFFVNEEIINSSMDSSLLDPALESSNFSAPGADRLKLVSELAVVPFDFTDYPDFVTLFTIKNGVVQVTNEKTQYNILGDSLAKRTYDESGDYVVKGFNVQIQEHDLVTTPISNYGRFTSGNNSLLLVNIDPGYGYVKGYPVVLRDKVSIEIVKPKNNKNVSSQIASTTMGQYVTVSELVGTWILDKGNRISFYDKPQKRITAGGGTSVTSNFKWSLGAQTGNNIGSGIINSIEYVTGTPGYDAQYNIYLSDITMLGSNTFSNVRSLYYSQSPSAIGADIYGATDTSSNTVLQSLSQAALLYYVGANYTKSVRASDGTAATIYFFNRTAGVDSSITTSSNGTLTLTPTLATKESIPYFGQLSDTDVSQDITMTFNESINVGPLWSGSSVTRSFAPGEENYLLGVGTKFTYLNIGDKIELSEAPANTFYVTGITSNTEMRLSAAVPGAVTASQIFKAYKTGDTLNLTGKGADNGAQRTVTATSSSLAFDLKETFPSEVDTTVTYKLALTNTSEAVKTLQSNRYVKINCATAGTSGPFCLGFSDVYQIRNIIQKSGSAPTGLADGTDVTKYFTLDNGQKDTVYDLAKIIKSPALSLGASDYLLVHLDYFVPSYTGRGGYFSINSYNIQDDDTLSSNTTIRTENIPVYVSPVTSAKFNLRNYLDFRPVKTITASDATTPAGATVNPSNTSTTYQILASGLKFPVPSTELIYDYSYYLGRKDIVVVGKDGTISVTQGGASDYPLIPDSTDAQMMLAILDIAPYPSLSPAYANALVRKDLSCGARKVSVRGYTMRDIGVLDKRIKNLEYYTSLTLLEKDALNLKVLDDNGNDRFKNGIFIDTFKDTSLSAKGSDPDFRIVTDPVELSIRPLFSTDSFQYNYISGDVAVNAGKITFNYEDVKFFAQTRVTDFRNLERGTYDYQGAMTLFPDQDVWIDTSYAPDEVVTTKANGATLSVSVSTSADVAAKVVKSYVNTSWEDWKTTVVGFNLYRGQGAAKRFVGRFNTEDQARAAAASWTTQPDAQSLAQVGIYNAAKGDVATLETVYYNKRLGTNWFSNESTDTAIGSNKLVSSEVIPYIRPQEIVVKCQGLKPYSLVNAFFDGVNVSAYCTPLTVDQFNLAIYKKPLPINGVAAMGDDLIVDTNGNVHFIFKIAVDGPKFRTGERKMVVMDGFQIAPATIEAELDASTQATAYFFADGTKQTLQRTVYSTSGFRITGENTSEDKNTFSDLVIPNTFVNPVPPKGHCCFDPNAKVLMANNTWKAIKDVMAGEQVIGEDEAVNTVISNNKVFVGDRKMMKFKSVDGGDFYSTDDHLFLTKKGWKTWDPGYLLRNPNTRNKDFLIGENREKGIDNDDYIRKIDVVDGMIVSNFIPYADLNVTAHDFDPDYAVYDLTLDGNSTYVVEGFVVHNCCVAYTILVQAPKDEEGIFVTSYDIFVQRKSATRGMWFELREMDAAGNITDTRIPGSDVHYDNNQINVSPDGVTNPTNVKFDAPIFLFNNKTYAFVVHSFSPAGMTIDPDTTIWIARLGEKDINTGATNIERQKMGKFFQTTNNKQWYEILDVDLTINVYRANFQLGTTSFILGNQPVEKFLLANVSSSLSGRVGDHFITGDTLTLKDANGTISVGYTLTGNISLGAANGVVVSIPGTNKYEMSNTRYNINDKVDLYYNGAYAGVTANVAAISNSTAQLSYYTESAANVYAEMISSTGGFTENTVIQSVRQAGYGYRAQITDIKDYNYSVVSWEPNILDFVKTNISYEMDTFANGSITSSGYETIYPSETHYFNEEKVIYSKTNELINLGTDVSNRIRVTFENNSEFVSPLLDLNSSHALIVDNLINANTVGEDAQSGGAALNKYISQTVTLAEGQDAEDLNVYLSAYRPPGTDVKVYCKLLNATDGEPLSQKSWVEMPKLGDGDITYSSISNRYNFKELSYGLPTDMMTGPNGEVQYTAGGTTFTSYKYYAVKIVLTSDNSATVPRVADLRAIALQI
ncbi:DUF4815 domain-containing protein [bacterium]|nr:DUF4815 domain-containing protein [bacterium]